MKKLLLLLLTLFFFVGSLQAQTEGTYLRLSGDSAVRQNYSLIDSNTLEPPAFVNGDFVVIDFGLFDQGEFRTNLYKYTNITLSVFTAQNTTLPPLMTQTITNTNLLTAGTNGLWNTNCNVGNWTSNAPGSTNFSAEFYFLDSQTGLCPTNDQQIQLWLRVYCVTTDAIPRTVTYLEAPITVVNGPVNPNQASPSWPGIFLDGTDFLSVNSSAAQNFQALTNALISQAPSLYGGGGGGGGGGGNPVQPGIGIVLTTNVIGTNLYQVINISGIVITNGQTQPVVISNSLEVAGGFLIVTNNSGVNEIIFEGTSQAAPGQNGIAWEFDGTSWWSEVVKTNTWNLAGNGFNGLSLTNSTKAAGFAGDVHTPGTYYGLAFNDGAGFSTASGAVTATSFSGGGSGLTGLNASALTSGTLPLAVFPSVLPNTVVSNITNYGLAFQSNAADGAFVLFTTNGHFSMQDETGELFFSKTNGTMGVSNTPQSTYSLFSNGSLFISGAANIGGNLSSTYWSVTGGSTGNTLSLLGNPSSAGALYGTAGWSNYNIGASQVTSFMQASNGLGALSNLIMYASTVNTLAYFNGSHQLSSGSVSADLGFSGGVLSLLGTYQGNAFITNGGSGASLTSLNAGNISSGTIGASYLPSALQFLNTNNGAALTNLAVPTLSSSNGSATLSQSINAKGGTNYDITAVSGGGSSTTNYQGIRVTNTADIGNVNVETNLNVTNNLIVGGIITGNGSGLTNLTPGILAASYFDNLVISNSVSTGSWGELIGAGGGGVYGETGAEVYYRSPGPAVMVDYIAPSINAGTNIYIVIRTNTPGGSSAAACICEVTNTAGITGPSDNLSTLNTSISIPAGILWDIQFTNNSSGNIVNGYFSVVVYGR